MIIARIEWHGETMWAERADEDLYRLDGDRFAPRRSEKLGQYVAAKVLAPIEQTNKIIGLLDNFDGRKGREGPGLFIKPYSTVIADRDDIVWPVTAGSVNFEVELAVVIGKRAKNVAKAKALDYVWGYSVANDMTSFATLMVDGQGSLSTRFKLFDNFLPLGPSIVTGLNVENLRLTSRLNGELKQDANTAQMAFGVAETIAWVSAVMSLEAGDVISMGTPVGFADMAPGDTIECTIEDIGTLTNRLVRNTCAQPPGVGAKKH